MNSEKENVGSKSWVLVETVSLFRERYLVQTPKDHPEYALDTVVLEEAKEFSSVHLGETIVSHRVVGEAEALEICDTDNAYARGWDTETKKANFFTPETEAK
jgi:hypothetical protein